MSVFTSLSPDIADYPILYPSITETHWISGDGEVCTPSKEELSQMLASNSPPLICHRNWTEKKIGAKLDKYLDILELFAFVKPAEFCLPTPTGLALATGLALPKTNFEKALLLRSVAYNLLDKISENVQLASDTESYNSFKMVGDIAEMMGQGGWHWAALILPVLGRSDIPKAPPTPAAAAIWNVLSEIQDTAPRGEPGIKPILPDMARNRLTEMLGPNSEIRKPQTDYAATNCVVFDQPDAGPNPTLLLSEAGTGIGKTLGYLAPASLWAEANDSSVWISTYTRTLQHQIADELRRLPEKQNNPEKFNNNNGSNSAQNSRNKETRRVVIRKGRENYLCLLNLDEALSQMPGQPANAIALGLMARWASASPDGDLTGASFPAWLVDLIQSRHTLGLADKRGECIHSACRHYHKCFVEKSVREARQADIVVANHALLILQSVFAQKDDRTLSSRLIFDEGHHVFDAADSAFSSALTASEASEMRRWIRGAEDGLKGRARGLRNRLSELISGDEKALSELESVIDVARELPSRGWQNRISSASQFGTAETFFSALRICLYSRVENTESLYDIQSEIYPAPLDIIKAAQDFAVNLTALLTPLTQLEASLLSIIDQNSESFDSQTKSRFESAIKSLQRRAIMPLTSWLLQLQDLASSEHGVTGRDGFVDWMQIDRIEGQDRDIGIYRHWLDPTIPFSEAVLQKAHGVAITSATLRDINLPTDPNSAKQEHSDNWQSAMQITGASHLPHPAIFSIHDSPFDYKNQTRILIVTDIARERPAATGAAMAALMKEAGGGSLGLFTAIQRLRAIYPYLAGQLASADIPLYAQHIDQMNLQTLLQLFRADKNSCLVGTDAVRDGIDVPGQALRMILYDRVPWPRPDMLFKARAKWIGKNELTDRLTRMKLRQAFGRLIRRADDKGIFVMLDSRLPTRLTSAFPSDVTIERLPLADALFQVRDFLGRQDEL